MTASRVAALVMIPLAIVLGAVGGHYWHVTHPAQVAALVDHLVPPAPEHAVPVPAPAASPVPAPAPAPAPAKPAPEVATRDGAPAVGSLPQVVPPKPEPGHAADDKSPSFDVVRVEPQGDAVVAGKGAPNAKVALLAEGKVVGEAKSDANGQFVIMPERLAPGDHALTLRQTPDGAPASDSTQSVAISVPRPGGDKSKVVVALAEPGKATKLLSPPPGAAAGAAATTPSDKVVIRSAELENGSGLYVSGAAPAGTGVHVYLNDAHIADVVAGADGAWSLRVKHGLTGGHYKVRADASGADGKVASRAEVPFDVPTVMAESAKSPVAPPPAAPAPAPAKAPDAPPAAATTTPAASPGAQPARATQTPDTTGAPKAEASAAPKSGEGDATAAAATSNATIETVATAHVTKGDNLWNISRYRLGDGLRYTQIYAANADQIRDPNLIYPGQVFVVPQR